MSNIEAKLVNDDLTLNIVDILSSLTGEQEQQLIEQLSCSDTIIKHVSDQIINGSTCEGYSGFISCDAGTSTALDHAVRAVAKSSSELATSEIESLELALKRATARADEYTNKYYDLIHGRSQ